MEIKLTAQYPLAVYSTRGLESLKQIGFRITTLYYLIESGAKGFVLYRYRCTVTYAMPIKMNEMSSSSSIFLGALSKSSFEGLSSLSGSYSFHEVNDYFSLVFSSNFTLTKKKTHSFFRITFLFLKSGWPRMIHWARSFLIELRIT